LTTETAINNVISQLRALASNYRGRAESLLDQGAAYLTGLTPPTLEEIDFEPERDKVIPERLPRPPDYATLKTPKFPADPRLQAYKPGKRLEFDEDRPEINVKNLTKAPPVVAPVPFYQNAPEPEDRRVNPVAPVLTDIAPVALTRPTAVQVDAVDVDIPGADPLLSFGDFDGSIQAQYQGGLSYVAADLTAWHDWIQRFRDDLLPIERTLRRKLQAVIDGEITGLPDDWEEQKYDQARQDVHAERYMALRGLDELPGAITGLPYGKRTYARLLIELKAHAANTQAASKTMQERQDREVKHLQWALDVAVKLVDFVLNFKAQEIAWRMEAMGIAVDGAQTAITIAGKVLDFKQREVAMLAEYNAGQLRRAELAISIEKTKLKKVQVALANNALTVEYNDHGSKAYQLAADFIETKIALFEAQIKYLTLDTAEKKLLAATYAADVDVYKIRVKRQTAEADQLRGTIKQDLITLDTELAKLRTYETELSVQAAEIRAQLDVATREREENRNKLDAWQAKADGQLAYLKLAQGIVKDSLVALTAGFAAETSEQELQLAQQQIADTAALHDAYNQLQVDHLALQKEIALYSIQLKQKQASAQVASQGASVSGSIAAHAYSGMTGLAAKEITEFA